MGAKHDELRTLLDSRFGSGSPATWYVGGSTTPSSADGSGFTEPTIGVGSYARSAKTNNAANFPAAATAGGRTTKTNGTDIEFPNPTGTWGVFVEIGFFTAATGGTPRWTVPLNVPISARSGNSPVEVPLGTLEIPAGGS